MPQVMCPGCQTTLELPPQVSAASVLCPRCKNPLVGTPADVPAPPMASPRPTFPAAPTFAPTTFTPATPSFSFSGAAPAVRGGPRRWGVLAACALAGILVVGLGLDVFLLMRSPGGAVTPQPGDPGDPGIVIPKGKGPPPVTGADRTLADAVDKGVAYLKEQILAGDTIYYPNDEGGGSALGPKALAGLTLLECNLGGADPAVARVAQEVRRDAPSLRYTYSICLAILFLDRLDREATTARREPYPGDRTILEDLSLRLIASQNTQGGWGYNCDLLTEAERNLLKDGLKSGAAAVGIKPAVYDDNSINQFVTLALWAARRHGVKVERSLKLAEDRYRRLQNPDGSWGYREKANDLKAATTCAGLIGLAVGRGIIDDKEVLKKLPPLATDDGVKNGMAYLREVVGKKPADLSKEEVARRRRHVADMLALSRKWHLSPETRDDTERRIRELDDIDLLRGTFLNVDAWGDLYFLWSVERVGVIFDLPKIGEVDWYSWGGPLILAQQRADGSWHDRFPGVPDTCFALLFLRRANVAQDLTDKLRGLLDAGPGPAAGPTPAPPRKEGS